MPRCSCFSARISSGDTKVMPSSPSATPSEARTRRASAAASVSATSAPLRFDVSIVITRPASTASRRPGLLGVTLVGLDDALDELVPHDVLVPELHEAD